MTPKSITLDGIEYDLVPKSSPDKNKKPTPDWEVLQYRFSSDGTIVPSQVQPDQLGTPELFEIYSVLRLIDKTTWTVGEETNYGTIEKFFVGWAGIEIHFTNGNGATLNSVLKKSSPDKKENRDWEIQSFFGHLDNSDVVYERGEDGKFWCYDLWLSESQLLNQKMPIKSVKRISDGVVFSVGEEVNSTWKKQKITEFIISSDNTMIAGFETCHNPLEKISKLLEKKPVFQLDNVDIFQGDEVWFITDNNFEIDSVKWDDNQHGLFPDNKYFSTEEKAKEYVTLNKPLLSVNDVEAICKNLALSPNISINVSKITEALTEFSKSKM